MSNIHTHTFRERRKLLDYCKNYYQDVYIPIWPTIVDINITKVKIYNKKYEMKGTFIPGTPFFKWMGVFQSVLDYFSVGG